MQSPFADCEAVLKQTKKNLPFRKEDFEIVEHYFECVETGKTFVDTHVGQLNLNQVYNQYREKYKIPFPEQIKNIREKYGVNVSKMSLILGVGANQYRNYENGEIPNTSNASLINRIKDSTNFRSQLEEKKLLLKEKEYDEILEHVNTLIAKEKHETTSWKDVKGFLWDSQIIPNEYTGYVAPDFKKFANMVVFFYERMNYLYLVRLNKLLFYSDFYHYKKTGYSISGMKYKAIQMGPVPDEYEFNYGLLVEEKYLEPVASSVNADYDAVVSYKSIQKFNQDIFKDSELNVLEAILATFQFQKTNEIISISHKEKGWIDNHKKKEYINYQKYAFELKAFNEYKKEAILMDQLIQKHKLKPADNIIVPKSDLRFVRHHAIYLGKDQYDRHLIIENKINIGVRMVLADEFFSDVKEITKIERFNGSEVEREKAVQRALASVGKPYDLLSYNCEHFANEVQFGKKVSHQANSGIDLGVLVGLGFLSFALGNDNKV